MRNDKFKDNVKEIVQQKHIIGRIITWTRVLLGNTPLYTSTNSLQLLLVNIIYMLKKEMINPIEFLVISSWWEMFSQSTVILKWINIVRASTVKRVFILMLNINAIMMWSFINFWTTSLLNRTLSTYLYTFSINLSY